MCMTAMIQIRNVPDDIHRRTKARAALEGVSMSELILRELERMLERPTRAELLERVSSRARVPLPAPAADLVRRERDSR